MIGDTPTSGTSAPSFRYELVPGWPSLLPEWDLVEASAAATDSSDRVYVFNRGPHPLTVLSSGGEILGEWDGVPFERAHGITIDSEDCVYCVDDLDHTVKKFTADGELLMTLGTSGQFSDTGATSVDFRNIKRSGPPFNFPTNVALNSAGEIFVADGYGNARIHRFAPDGRLVQSWGEPGAGPGQFRIPHGIAIDRNGVLYVADRENSRIQRFTESGNFIDAWSDVARPCDVYIDAEDIVYVAELGYHAGMWPGTSAPSADSPGGRVSLFTTDGEVLTRLGAQSDPPINFFAPHDIWVDSQGSIYVSEVIVSASSMSGEVPSNCSTLKKLIRQMPAA